MASMRAPYTPAMRLGSGFNSFTQQLCIHDAVARDPNDKVTPVSVENRPIAQSVSYQTKIIDKATDVSKAMDINAAVMVKYDALNVDAGGKFANSSKIKESDISFMFTVKVVNQVIYDYALTQFQPIAGLKNLSAAQLNEIYGDSFISGFEEGGDFTAVISIKVRDRTKRDEMVANARVDFTNAKPAAQQIEADKKEAPAKEETSDKDAPAKETAAKEGEERKGKKDLAVTVDGFFDTRGREIMKENETTITVSWTGGGQDLKGSAEDWTYETMRDAALKFPDLVATTPMRTHAILTKYTALRTFYGSQIFDLPNYDKTGTYTGVLQEAYLDYKTIQKNLQVTAYDVSEGLKTLTFNPRYADKNGKSLIAASTTPSKPRSKTTTPSVTDEASEKADDEEQKVGETLGDQSPVMLGVGAEISTNKIPAPKPVISYRPLVLDQPYEPSLEGLEEARLHVRYMMNRIIQEIDNVSRNPDLAIREDYTPPYMSPFLFKRLLPISIKVPTQATVAEQQAMATKADNTDFAKQYTSMISGK